MVAAGSPCLPCHSSTAGPGIFFTLLFFFTSGSGCQATAKERCLILQQKDDGYVWKAQLEPALLRDERAGRMAGGRRARGTSLPGGPAVGDREGHQPLAFLAALVPTPPRKRLEKPPPPSRGPGPFPAGSRTPAAPRRYRLP